MATPLHELSRQSGSPFPNLTEAKRLSESKLAARRTALSDLDLPEDSSVVYVGSIGRSEAVEGSDDDFMLLVKEAQGTDQGRQQIGLIKASLRTLSDFKDPSGSGPFAHPVIRNNLIEKIGLSADDNDNTTRRMLFLLESQWAWGEGLYRETFDLMLRRYIDRSVKDYRPPRFILNDLIRYWRTMCVDFAGKEYKGPEKWGIRNAKLRSSRKMLFAGGLLPVLACSKLPREEMVPYLKQEFALPPTDRIASAFLKHNETIDAGGRTLSAYDELLGILNDPDCRKELESLERGAADNSPTFKRIRELGANIQSGLIALLFQPGDSTDLARNYLIF